MILNNHWVYSNSWSGCSSIGCPRKEEEYVLNFRWLLLVDAFQLKCMLFRSNWRFIFYFTYLKYRKKNIFFFHFWNSPLLQFWETHIKTEMAEMVQNTAELATLDSCNHSMKFTCLKSYVFFDIYVQTFSLEIMMILLLFSWYLPHILLPFTIYTLEDQKKSLNIVKYSFMNGN